MCTFRKLNSNPRGKETNLLKIKALTAVTMGRKDDLSLDNQGTQILLNQAAVN